MINPLEIINKYYPAGSKVHFNLDQTFIAEAAMLHDIGIFKCDAPRIHCHGTHQYIEHGYLGADLLRTEGLPRHALVCERHTGVGLTLEMIERTNLPLPHRDLIPVSLEEQLICYADKFFSKTQLEEAHSIDRIRKYLGRYGDDEVKKFDNWNRLFE